MQTLTENQQHFIRLYFILLANFYPDSNPNNPIRGVFTPAPNKGDPASFNPLHPSDYGSKIPFTPTQATIVPENPGFEQPHGTLYPSQFPTERSKFIQDPPGASPADFFPDRQTSGGASSTPISDLLKSTPLSTTGPTDFQPSNPSTTATDSVHGKMLPKKPPGSMAVSGTLQYKPDAQQQPLGGGGSPSSSENLSSNGYSLQIPKDHHQPLTSLIVIQINRFSVFTLHPNPLEMDQGTSSRIIQRIHQ
jgi:hypothetical protein